jgi:ABC-2 type transport system ATP-binding protein
VADVSETLLACEGVSKRYGDVTALTGVDLSVTPGTVHCLAGPNGSGKSTLLGILSGLVRPDGGRVERPSVGVGFQRPRVYEALTVAENLSVFADLADVPEGRRAAVVERLGLEPVQDRVARALSDGYARKLDVALALLGEPAALLLDEPLGTLDEHTARQLRAVVADYPGETRAVVVASHDIDRFHGVIDRLTVLDGGSVLLDEPVENLASTPGEAYTAALRAADDSG